MTDRDETRKDPAAILWTAANRNAMTEIAKQCDVTAQFVSLVLYGRRKSKDGKVERLLRAKGAPIKVG